MLHGCQHVFRIVCAGPSENGWKAAWWPVVVVTDRQYTYFQESDGQYADEAMAAVFAGA
jgi:hypothetical protein